MIDRMTAIMEREGNPEGVEIKRLETCTAFYSKTMPWGQFNNIKGSIDEDTLNELLQFYRLRDRKFEIQVIPSKVNKSVLQLMHHNGFYQSAFHTTMYGEPYKVEPYNSKVIHIRELNATEFDTYAEIHCLGTGLSIDGKQFVAANNKVLYDRAGWSFYIGEYKGTPAAVAVMYIHEGIASLTFAATLPQFRNKGLQTSLLKRRINDAYIKQCKLVVGQCGYTSQSHRNMERVGMKIGYTRSTWTEAIMNEY